MYAEIIINSNARALNRIFDYIIPKEMETSIKVGSRIFVPFGNGKKLEDGFVIGIKETSEFANKKIAKIDEQESLSEENVILAKLMARKYFCNISDCIKLMLPPGTTTKIITNRVKEKTANYANLKVEDIEIEEAIEFKKIKSEKQIRILKFLINNGETLVQDLELFTDTTRSIIKTLEKNGYIEIIEKQVERNPFIHKVVNESKDLNLTDEQSKAYEEISECIDMGIYSSFLLFGVTGSRKNRSVFTIN